MYKHVPLLLRGTSSNSLICCLADVYNSPQFFPMQGVPTKVKASTAPNRLPFLLGIARKIPIAPCFSPDHTPPFLILTPTPISCSQPISQGEASFNFSDLFNQASSTQGWDQLPAGNAFDTAGADPLEAQSTVPSSQQAEGTGRRAANIEFLNPPTWQNPPTAVPSFLWRPLAPTELIAEEVKRPTLFFPDQPCSSHVPAVKNHQEM
jgi:hypothetical protein